jgi:RNA polymerase sigma factor (sigma-70 family)
MPPSALSPAATPSASSEEDRALVRRALGEGGRPGDEAAYARLVGKYRDPLVRHVGQMMRSAVDVEDLVQEAFVKAFGSLASYSPEYAFSTWLYRIATNHAIDHIRRRRLPTVSIDKPIQTQDGEVQAEIPDSTYRPDRAIVESQRGAILREAVDALPEKYHRVIVMRHHEEMSYEDIAETLGLPLGTVKAHIFRARALLNKALRDRRDDLD